MGTYREHVAALRLADTGTDPDWERPKPQPGAARVVLELDDAAFFRAAIDICERSHCYAKELIADETVRYPLRVALSRVLERHRLRVADEKRRGRAA
jgi:hypothetical protein